MHKAGKLGGRKKDQSRKVGGHQWKRCGESHYRSRGATPASGQERRPKEGGKKKRDSRKLYGPLLEHNEERGQGTAVNSRTTEARQSTAEKKGERGVTKNYSCLKRQPQRGKSGRCQPGSAPARSFLKRGHRKGVDALSISRRSLARGGDIASAVRAARTNYVERKLLYD